MQTSRTTNARTGQSPRHATSSAVLFGRSKEPRPSRVLVLLLTLLSFPTAAVAGEFVVFSKTYVRGTGAPETVTATFDVLNPATQWTLRATNGNLSDDALERVSSSTLILNGLEILRENAFNQNVASLHAGVALLQSNLISVQVRGKPGGQLAIEVVGQDIVAPVVTWQSPTDGLVTDTSVLLSRLTLSDDIAGLDPSSFKVLLDGIPLASSFPPIEQSVLDATLSSTIIAAEGTHELIATVRDRAGNIATSSVSFTVDLGPPPVPTLNPHAMITNLNPIGISGTAQRGVSVEISGPQGVFDVPVIGSSYTADVPLSENHVNRLFLTTISASGERSAPISLVVTHDMQPPNLFIDFPENGSEITTEFVDVGGRVGDLLTGFMGLSVVVNGQPAVVDVGIGNNGTFFATNVPLSVGANVISATAVDELGNAVTEQISVQRVDIPPSDARMFVVSGNRQTGPVNTSLPEPLLVRILRPDGLGFANKVVTFRVVRSNGRLSSDGGGDGGLMIQGRTDAAGEARVFWRLGSDAGCGNNRVTVTSKDIPGTVLFCASSLPGPATQINVGSGGNQRAESGSLAPEPLIVWVNDACNGVPAVPVTFRVTQGGAFVNGQDFVIVTTDNTGHAAATLTLGPAPGNNRVEVDFAGNLNAPAVFMISGVVRDDAQPTSLSGIVLDNASRALQGATCTLLIGASESVTTSTDASGQFAFVNLLGAGPAELFIDGQSVFAVRGAPTPQGSFPSLKYDLILVPNTENTLTTPVLLPPLDPTNAVPFDNSQDVELTVAAIEGLRMIVRAGSMTRADGTRPSPSNPAILSLNQVHFDDVPMPMPDGASPPFAWTLQPSGARFDPPVEIVYPNISGLPAGSIAYFLSFDHDTGRFEIIATGQVTEDGSSIVSDPGAGILTAGWGCNCPPYAVTGNAKRCPNPPSILSECGENDFIPFFKRSPDNNQGNRNTRFENHIQWEGGGASLKDGNLTVSHKLVTYRRLGAERGIELVYSSNSAHPRPIVPLSMDGSAGVFAATVSIEGLPEVASLFQKTSPGVGRFTFQADASSLKTGVYPYTVQLDDQQGTVETISDFLLVRNEINSPIGAGWTIAEIHEVANADDGTAFLFALGNGTNTVIDNPNNKPPTTRCNRPLPWHHPTSEGRTPGDFSNINVEANGNISRIMQNGTRQVYANGNLGTKTDRNGNETRYVYVGEFLAQIIDPTGAITVFQYNDRNLLASIQHPGDATTFLEYDGSNNLISITDADGTTRNFGYGPNHRLRFDFGKIAVNPPTEFVYNQSTGRLADIVFPDGAIRSISPAQANTDGLPCESVATYTDATGFEYDVEMDQFGRILRIVDPSGATRMWERDEDGLPVSSEDGLGNVTGMKYDGTGNLVETTTAQPFLYKTSRSYHPTFNFLTQLTDPNGQSTNFVYDDITGNLIESRDVFQNSATFRYNEKGLPVEAIDRNGNITTWTYDDSAMGTGTWLPTSRTTASGDLNITTHFRDYTPAGFPQELEDSRGTLTKLSYDAMNRVTSIIVDAATGGKALTSSFTYEPDGRLATTTTPHTAADTATTTREYDSRRRVVRVVNPELAVTTFGYDAEGRLKSVTDAENHTRTIDYDLAGRAVTTTDAAGQSATQRHDANYNVIESTNENGVVTTLAYDELNRILKTIVNPGPGGLNLTSEIIYPTLLESGSIEGQKPYRTIDPEGNVAEFQYDLLDRVIKQTRIAFDAVSIVSAFSYDNEGRLTIATDPNDMVTLFEYDGANRLVREVLDALPSGLQLTTRRAYDGNGNLTEIRLPNGNVITNTYDAANRLTLTEDLIGQVSRNVYDPAGRVVEALDGDDRRTAFTYDKVDRLLTITDGLGKTETFTFDKVGNETTARDRNSNLTTFEYDNLNRLVTTREPLGLTTSFEYDQLGNQTLIRDANGGTTSFEYDNANRMVKRAFADGGLLAFAHDKVGNITRQTNPDGGVITFAYDDLYLLRTRTYLEGTDAYSYDATGRMLTADNAVTNVAFEYDAADRVTSIKQGLLTTGFAYDLSEIANRRTITYPSGRVIVEKYDKRDRMIDTGDGASIAQYTYTLAGFRKTITFGNGVTSTRSYDNNGRLKTVKHTKVADFINMLYGYDPVGNLTFSQRLRDTDNSVIGQYDALNRLVQFDRGVVQVGLMDVPSLVSPSTLPDLMQAQTWTNLDPLSNWLETSVTKDGATESEFRQANEVNEYLGRGTNPQLFNPTNGTPAPGTVAISHDENGNTIDDGEFAYTYDTLNRLLSVARKADATVVLRNEYDARDFRVRATDESGAATEFVFDSDWRVLEDRPSAGALTSIVHGPGQDEPLERRQGGVSHFFHATKLGTIDAVTDSAGQVVESYRYDAYGRRLVYDSAGASLGSSAIGNQLGLSGRPHESCDLIDLRNRFYHTELGRFVHRDPAGFGGGANLYQYASSAPLGRFDLFGLQDEEDIITLQGNELFSGGGIIDEDLFQLGLDAAAASESSIAAVDGTAESDGTARSGSLGTRNLTREEFESLIRERDDLASDQDALITRRFIRETFGLLNPGEKEILDDQIESLGGSIFQLELRSAPLSAEPSFIQPVDFIPLSAVGNAVSKLAGKGASPVAKFTLGVVDDVGPGAVGSLRARVRVLGTDPTRGFIKAEGIGGVRIEQALGRTIRRSVDDAADFVDNVFGPISLKGPIPAKGSVEGLANAANKDARFNTFTNALFVDLRGLSAAQRSMVRTLVKAGTSSAKKGISFLD